MSKTRAIAELGLVLGLIATAIWVAPLYPDRVMAKRIGTGLAGAAFAVAVASTLWHGDGWRDIGVRFDNIRRSFGWLMIPTALVVAGLVAVGYVGESLHFGARRFRWDKMLWALVQEYLMQGFMNRRLQDVFGQGWWSIGAAALIFAGLHAPNPVLMLATFLAGCLWARGFQRDPNLFAVAASHFVLAYVLGRTLPATLLPNMRVGWSYWR